MLYCAVRIKCEKMVNHSANLAFVYLGEQKQLLIQEFTYPTGVTGTQGWIRFVGLRVPPPEAKFVSVALVVYPNGNRPGTAPENVWFSDFRFLPR